MAAAVQSSERGLEASKKYDDGVSDDTSGSDFDDEEDPDKIEVPGGGKDLATAAVIGSIKEEKPPITDLPTNPLDKTQGPLNELNQKFGNKIPGGLVTKNATPGYEMVHVGGSQGTSPGNFVGGTGQMNQLNQLATGGYPGFPPGLNLAGFNPAAFLQS
ncbi:PREDICTED: uncharacterized protein LOC105625173, partial [Atta cephalotes]|uniref:Uncharacterized protein n=1 Tax=Atta cephalotes TaxID=12957 RepID=A0A158NWJ6_ATTCE